MSHTTGSLHFHKFLPSQPASISEAVPKVLALHGLTGHGQRWETFARNHIPEYEVTAPDLRGHGFSPWDPPWNLERHVADLQRFLNKNDHTIVVGHSFGGAVALHLAKTCPELIHGLVLVDPAIEVSPPWIRSLTEATVASPDYASAEEARQDKVNGAWRNVPPELLDAELKEHLVKLPTGRMNWRICVPAIITGFGELARPTVAPAKPIPTTLLRATRQSPPFVTPAAITTLRAALGDHLTLIDVDSDHMVTHEKPELIATAIRDIARQLAPQ
ncbi:alpha/beta fold hydrolase [Hoyosella rhizosphaerae]|uniref:alpha/beta fold hydrolase n=1 Tax=Hoyosella rhizosphaerae TaxID=1755582 RepID=UPI001E567730|nr:alpha/beta hydrolase [Hoyosella rhizosphaerae]